MSGDRQLVRRAVAQYFGGPLVQGDAGICYQKGPLTASGLGSVFPYEAKGVPDPYYFAGMPTGSPWGSAMGLKLARDTVRDSYGGAKSGWRARTYTVTCEIAVLSLAPHLETAGEGLDDLIDAIHGLIYADRTLGTTSSQYPTGRLITQAGEGRYGIKDSTNPWEPKPGDERGRYFGEGIVSFEVLTMVSA